MRLLSTLLWIALFAVLLVFSIANTDPVTVRLFGQAFSVPLVLLLVLFFAAGAVAGLLAALPGWFRSRREIARLARELADAQRAAGMAGAGAAGSAAGLAGAAGPAGALDPAGGAAGVPAIAAAAGPAPASALAAAPAIEAARR